MPSPPASSRTPADLAQTVYQALEKRTAACPKKDSLVRLFECLYFASLQTEESRPITIHIVYINPEDPDPKPPARIVNDRWNHVPLGKRIRMSAPNLVKIAKASDPRSSSLAVYPEASGHLSVWGLIDQGNRYHEFVNHESESGPDRPGLFQASIAGVGHVVAYMGYEKIAELRISTLIRSEPDVLHAGPIREKLEVGIQMHLRGIRSKLPSRMRDDLPNWSLGIAEAWIASICRLLLRIRNYGNGGALLIAPGGSSEELGIQHQIIYRRLREALEHQAISRIQAAYASDEIFQRMDEGEDEIPLDLYLDETINDGEADDGRSELEGAIWFVSLLSRVDGLVLMNPSLEVRGFGVEITSQGKPGKVFRTRDRAAKPNKLHRLSYERFGTRHRSMMRYCYKHPAAIGFVVSQDGDVRVISRVKGKLVMWENIKLQLLDFIPRRKPRKRLATDTSD